MTFAEKLRQLREERGWSQNDLATASGVSVWAIRDYEQAKRRFDPGLQLLVKLAKALGISLDVFADCAGTDDAQPTAKPKKQTPPPVKAKRARRRKTE
jgi:transcriptional regulator with XRE-family HTH domain